MAKSYDGFFRLWQGLLATAGKDGLFRHLTPAWERTLGWSIDELRARPLIEFVHADDREATLAEVAKLFRGEPSVRFENRYLCKDGSYKWILWSSFVDADGPPEEHLIYATAHDITEHVETRRRFEVALAETQALRSLMEATSDLVGVANLEGIVTYINEAGLKMAGWTADELGGAPIAAFYPPAYGDVLLREAIPHAIEHGVWNGEGELMRRDGVTIPISQVVVPMRDASGQLCALGTIARDISRSKALEAELREQKDRLAAAVQAMSTPLIPITREIVVMPLIGQMDTERADRVMEVALSGIQQSGAQVVILDVTGLAVVDSQVAAALVRAARALRLLGARTVLTGIQPAVAQTLVGLGLDFEGITTHSTLQSAITAALRGAASPSPAPRRT